MLTETLRKRRGHDFYPPAGLEVPPLYATEDTPAEDKLVVLHDFSAAGDWWITELDRETGEAYGYVRLAAFPEGAEWGYVSLPELEAVSAYGGLVIVERDLWWEPVKFADIPDAHR